MVEAVAIRPANWDAVRILQITDSHIAADPAARFAGVDTSATLAAVVNAIRERGAPPDCVLATGDLVDDATHAAYRRLLPLLQTLDAPVYCIPGNHDEPGLLKAVLNGGNVSTPRAIDAGPWRIMLLDTYVPGSDGGRLAPAELEFLRQGLADSRRGYALVCLHHPPVSIHSPWMDEMGLTNPDEFFSVLDDFTHVRAVIWGHIHQEFEAERNGVLLLAAPSTCVQFAPRTSEYIVDDLSPGYRELNLRPDGHLETKVYRL